MEINFKEKPDQKLVEKYEKKLSEFLQAHNLIIKIIIRDKSLPLPFYHIVKSNNSGINYWISNIDIKMENGKKIILEPWFCDLFGIDKNMDDAILWNIAYSIQKGLYKELNIEEFINNPDDPYWKLWEYYPKNSK